MFGKDKKKDIVGAKEKIATAKRLRNQAQTEMLQKIGQAKSYSQAIPITFVYVLAVLYAMFLTDANSSLFANIRLTGDHGLDQLLTGSSVPVLVGDRALDRLFTILIRGFAFFIAAGIIPLVSYIVLRIADRTRLNPLVVCWGSIVTLPLLCYIMSDNLLPALKDVIDGF